MTNIIKNNKLYINSVFIKYKVNIKKRNDVALICYYWAYKNFVFNLVIKVLFSERIDIIKVLIKYCAYYNKNCLGQCYYERI